MAARRHWRYYLSVLVVHLLIECSYFPQDRLKNMLETLGISRAELFVQQGEITKRRQGTISTQELLRVLELRMKGRSWKQIVPVLVNEGNVELDHMDADEAVNLLSVSFTKHFSDKARTAFRNLLAGRS